MGNNINESYIVDYIRKIIPERKKEILEMEEYAEKNKIPIVEPEVAQLLSLFMKIKKPKSVLEIGTAIGYSSSVLYHAYNTKITTIEKRKDLSSIAEDNYRKQGITSINLLEGDALEVLDELYKQEKKYDLIFLDAAKGQYIKFFEKSYPLLRDEGILISDNVLFKGMVASDKLVNRRKVTIVKRLREYLEYINKIDGLVTSVIPIGDGVAVTFKEE